ncbi:MAG TPA: GNAT family N-acetyltransferase [Usitatibacter sp.]|nr:GNAT family N-acetyltransferase [Usitatibacter sp.]
MDSGQGDIRQGEGDFFIEDGGRRVAELTFHRANGDVVVTHTWVDPARRGQGDARRLVEAAVTLARAEKVRIVALCPYVGKVLRGEAYRDVLKAGP